VRSREHGGRRGDHARGGERREPTATGARVGRARWGGDAIGEGFIRFSVGCEATEDLLADVAQALDTIAGSKETAENHLQ
jgi:hypothetical protein